MPLLARPSQQPLLAAQRPFAQEGQAKRRPASGAGKGLGKGPSVVDGRLDFPCGGVVAEAHGRLADAFDRQLTWVRRFRSVRRAKRRLPRSRARRCGRVDRRLAEAEFRLIYRRPVNCQYRNKVNSQCPRNGCLVTSPVSTLIDRFRPLQGGVGSPVRATLDAAFKYLIQIYLSRIIRANLAAGSIIQPVFRFLQGSGLRRLASRAVPRSGGYGRG